ncbi:MAG: hypothetical protein ACLFS3_02910 [Candidatus Aenigmatarchaeota archaeon]
MSENSGPKNPDLTKVKNLLSTLRKYPQGIWLRKLSRESDISPSTVHYYINNVVDSFIVSQGAKDSEGKYFGIRLIKLREGVRKQLDSGKTVEYLLKTKDILTDNS